MIVIISFFDPEKSSNCKPLELINGKMLLEICLENFIFTESTKFIFLLSEEFKINYSLDIIIKKILPNNNVTIYTIDDSTLGLPETVLKVENIIEDNESIIVYSPYIFISHKIDIEKLSGNYIFYFKSNSHNHSYAVINNNKVEKIREKIVISNNALIGIYGFENKEILIKYIKKLIKDNIKFDNRYYMSLIYNLMIDDKILINSYKIESMYPLGSELERNIIEKLFFRSISKNSKIGLASDHSGFEAKKCMIKIFEDLKVDYIDYGCYTDKDCDYNLFIKNLTTDLDLNKVDYGFGFCRTGQGVNICANKQPNIISALIYDNFTCQMAVEHNGCNFFCFPEKDSNIEKFSNYLDILFNSKFLGGRFLTRYIRNISN